MKASDLKKGFRIQIVGNEIFKMMGHARVTGRVFSFHGGGSGCSFKCDQTGAIEGADFEDGQWEILDRQTD